MDRAAVPVRPVVAVARAVRRVVPSTDKLDGQHLFTRVDGRRLATLVDGPLPAGRHAVNWDGRDDTGRGVASGAYLFRVRAGTWSGTGKLLLVR